MSEQKQWLCATCGKMNDADFVKCKVCGQAKPGVEDAPKKSCKSCGSIFTKDECCPACGSEEFLQL